MKRTTKGTIASALAAAAMTAGIIGLTSTGAFAIDEVPCNAPDYTKITYHYLDTGGEESKCYANGGTVAITPGDADFYAWLDGIDTGNNRVQWFGDDKWQPQDPIPAHTHMDWPHGAVKFTRIRIV